MSGFLCFMFFITERKKNNYALNFIFDLCSGTIVDISAFISLLPPCSFSGGTY